MILSAVATAPSPPARARGARGVWSATSSFLGTVMTVLVVVVACVTVVVAIASRFSKNDQYTLFGHPGLVVVSGSMAPAINTGDFIIDNPAQGATNLKAGQIITFFDAPGSKVVITHRIVKVVHRNAVGLPGVYYRTKGDANPSADPGLRPASTVIGVYLAKIPKGGYLLTNLKKPLVLGLLLAAPVLWILSGFLRDWARQEDQPKDTTPASEPASPETTEAVSE